MVALDNDFSSFREGLNNFFRKFAERGWRFVSFRKHGCVDGWSLPGDPEIEKTGD